MVSIYGLSKAIGNISYYDPNGSAFQKPYSEKRSEDIDNEVSKIIEAQYDRAKKILLENKDKLTALADELLKNEVIFKDDLVKIFGERVWDLNKDRTNEGKIEEVFTKEEPVAPVESPSKVEFAKPAEFSKPEASKSDENSVSSHEEEASKEDDSESKKEEDGK
jgi:cell division protease FtsH